MNRYIWPSGPALLFLGLAMLPAQAATNLELLAPQSGEFRSSQDPIQIQLKQAVSKNDWMYLHLEVDSIDVTEYVSIINGQLSYFPQEQLTAGPHQVRLVALLPDGNINELANWQIDIKASSTFREASIESNLGLQVTQRVADDYDDDTIDKTQAQGSYVFSSNHATENWRLTSNADFMYNSQYDQTQNGRKFDVNEFNLKSEWSQSSVTLGHHALPVSSLVMTDFNRRGASATVNNETNSFAATGFAMRTEAITGFQDGLGIGNEDKRISGAYVRLNPVSEAAEKLIVSGIYFDGRGSSEGEAEISGGVEPGEGDASSVSVESYLDNKRLYLRGERATSSFDFDGHDIGYAAEKDKARSFYIQYATERNEQRAEAYNWNLGFLHQRVGQWFHSLGNATLPSDKESNQLFAAYMSTQWQVNASMGVEQSNVEDDATVPTIESQILTTNLSYSPQADPEKPQSGIFSNPNYTLSVIQYQNEQTHTPAGFAGDFVDLENREISLAASFSGDNWYWSLSHTQSDEEDLTNLNSDFETQITSLEANFALNSQFSLTPVLQVTENMDVDQNITTDGENAGLTLQYTNNDDWNASIGYSVNSEKANDGFTDSRSELVEMQTTWVYQHPSDNKPGINYFARGSYAETEDQGITDDQYQVFLGVSIAWPANF